MNFRRRPQEEPEINIISMVDVVLVLLLFFMVSTSFIRPSALNMELPESSQEAKQPERSVTVDVDAIGQVALNGQIVLVSELADKLEALAGQSKNRILLLRSDRNTTQQHVVNVLDAARQAGFLHISMATIQK